MYMCVRVCVCTCACVCIYIYVCVCVLLECKYGCKRGSDEEKEGEKERVCVGMQMHA
jgi:hypothetical protein